VTSRRVLARTARSRPANPLSIFRLLIETIDRGRRSERTAADLKIETTFSGRQVSRQFTTEPGQSAPRFEIQIGMRNRNRADGIGAFSSLALRRRWRGEWRAREEAERVEDVGAEKPRDAGGEGPEEGSCSRARVSLNLNLRFAGPPLVSLVFILSRGPCVPLSRCFPKSSDRASYRFSRYS